MKRSLPNDNLEFLPNKYTSGQIPTIKHKELAEKR